MALDVGFIGLGIMGRPMALNLLGAGSRLVVYNRTTAKSAPLAEAGAVVAASPQEVAERVEVLITMLSDSPDVEQVYFGEQGVLAGARPRQLLIDMSTVAPAVARAVAAAASERGAHALDAPVSGGDVGAQEATLSIMVGGEEAAFQRALPILRALGRTIVHVGPSGAGQTAKACNQILVALTIEAVSETLVLASKAGVDPADLVEVLSAGMAGSRVLELRGRRMLEHDFTPGFKVKLHHKDLRIALDLAREVGVELDSTVAVERMLAQLIDEERGEEDNSALLRLVERRASHELGRTSGDGGAGGS